MWWMAGTHNDIHGSNKLRPLMPRQPTIMQTHSNNILPWNHHHHPVVIGHEYGFKRDPGVTLVSTRWNPTPEQLQGLEELYRRGTRTPSAEQIQHIASRLRRFGKIEGKNVFYWFQNHKARERQKKRRQLHQPGPAASPGLSKRSSYLGHNKLSTPSNFTTTLPQEEEESASMHGSVIAERKKDVWTQSPHHNKDEIITSWKLDLSPFNNNMYTSIPRPGQENTDPTNDVVGESETGTKQNRTLQLFPIRAVDDSNVLTNHEDQIRDRDDGSGVCLGNESGLNNNNNQFIEFLPTKKYI